MQKCEPTQTPEVDRDALRDKYLAERDKRIRKDGGSQYIVAGGEFEEFYSSDPYTAVAPRLPIDEDIEVLIIGGGIAGLVNAHALQNAGVDDFKILDHGGDFGGVWYWNRYPGIQVDTDAYCYLPLLEQTGYIPTQKYTQGHEVLEHLQRIGKHFGLYDHAIFSTRITSQVWDEEIKRWRLTTDREDDIRARYIIMAQGPFNRPKLPGIPGIETYTGHTIHTARWDYDYTGGDSQGGLDKLAGKRVAVIGTGASGVQVIPHIAESAEHLYVFQRTASTIDERGNVPTDPEWVKTLQPGWQEERRHNFHTAAYEAFAPGQPDLICDGWTEISRNLQAKLDATNGWAALADPAEFMRLREIVDYEVMERLRGRVEAIVENEETAEILKPYYRFLCKRPLFSDTYLPTFNRSNVTLIDVSATKGVERITPTGIVANGVEHEVDLIVFASGFEITTELDRRLALDPYTGRDGLSLYDHWRDGYKTLHGMMTHGFPNHFFTGYIQGGITAAVSAMFEQQAPHIAYIIKEAQTRGATSVEPTQEAQDQWVATIRANEIDQSTFTSECTPGYYNNEGEKVVRSVLGEPFWGGFYPFGDLLQAWRDAGDLKGLTLAR